MLTWKTRVTFLTWQSNQSRFSLRTTWSLETRKSRISFLTSSGYYCLKQMHYNNWILYIDLLTSLDQTQCFYMYFWLFQMCFYDYMYIVLTVVLPRFRNSLSNVVTWLANSWYWSQVKHSEIFKPDLYIKKI